MSQHPPGRSATPLPDALVEEFRRTHPKSQEIFQRARRSLPGGQTRSVTHYAPFPAVITSGNGYILRDADGIEYIDLVNNYTSLVHGNAFAPVTEAVAEALPRGTAFASIHTTQIALAETITQRVASIESLRFTNSGSEASTLAARIAQRQTGRTEIVVAAGGYHGAVPPFSDPGNMPGVRIVPFNDLAALSDAVTEHTAAVFLEPFQGAGGVIVGTQEYLAHAEWVARQHGAFFVLDEVQSLRNNYGGAQAELGLSPDLTVLGKVIGGGFPIGAVGGREDAMATTSPYTPNALSHAGTFNGHIASVVAGAHTLAHLDAETIRSLNGRAARLAACIESAGSAVGLKVSVTRAGSILNVYLGEGPRSAREAASQPEFHTALHLALLLEGVYTTTRGMVNLSTVMTDEVIDELGKRYQAAMHRLSGHPSTNPLTTDSKEGSTHK